MVAYMKCHYCATSLREEYNGQLFATITIPYDTEQSLSIKQFYRSRLNH